MCLDKNSFKNKFLTSGSARTRKLYQFETMFFFNCFYCSNSVNFSDSGTSCGQKFILKVELTQNYAMLLY